MPADSEAYRLPDLLAWLPKKPGGEINLHFEEANAAFNEWVEKKFDPSTAAEVLECQTPLGISVSFPLASSQQLRGIIDYTAAGFLIDDAIERTPSETLPALLQSWMETLRDGGETKRAQHPVVEMMRSEMMNSIKAAIGSFHWPQFVSGNEKMLKAMVQEAYDQKAHPNQKTLDVKSYLIQRRPTVGTCVFFTVAQATRSLYIPDDVLYDPVVQEMYDAATDALSIANDIYSFKKEYNFDRAFHNILTTMEKDPETCCLDFQGRLDHAEKLFIAALERFGECRRKLPSFGPEMDQCVASYADGMIDVMVGNLQWSRVVRRYNTFVHDEDRRNFVIRLALSATGSEPSANKDDVSA